MGVWNAAWSSKPGNISLDSKPLSQAAAGNIIPNGLTEIDKLVWANLDLLDYTSVPEGVHEAAKASYEDQCGKLLGRRHKIERKCFSKLRTKLHDDKVLDSDKEAIRMYKAFR